MVVGSLSWSLLLLSHLLRSIWDWRASTRLELDLAGLRLEVHRARELLESYNLVVDDCHAQVSWLRSANYFVTSVNILLGILVFGLAFWTFLVRGPHPPAVAEVPALEDFDLPSVEVAIRKGPARPSDFGKGRQLRV